jgi:copper transport protein
MLAFAAAVRLLLIAKPVSAHTGFESSDPADRTEVTDPVETIILVFTGEAEPTGEGFLVLDANGTQREPTERSTDDGKTWFLQFDPALGPGMIGVRWTVVAPDSHPIEGSFSFTVTAAPNGVSDASVAEPAVSATGGLPATTNEGLEEFLEPSSSPSGPGRVAAVARFLALVGTVTAIGGLVFAATALRGERSEVLRILHWVRRSGLLVGIGALGELVSQVVIAGGGDWGSAVSYGAIRDTVGSDFGIAVGLRLLGAGLIVTGVRFDIVSASEAPDPALAFRSLLGAGVAAAIGRPPGEAGSEPPYAPPAGREEVTWAATSTSIGAVVGAAAVVVAHSFDGHTVTEGSRLLTAVADVIHVAAGAVWAGGVVMLAAVLTDRRRRGRDLDALALAVRFSVVASVAVVAAGVAGVALTVTVLDAPSQLWSSDWGRTLMAKTVLVLIAGCFGAYNHRVVIPALEATPHDSALARHFRSTVTAEAVVLAVVVAAAAVLMGAAT